MLLAQHLLVLLVSRRPTLKRGSGETVYKKFGAAGMLEAPIRSLHFKIDYVMRTFQKIRGLRLITSA